MIKRRGFFGGALAAMAAPFVARPARAEAVSVPLLPATVPPTAEALAKAERAAKLKTFAEVLRGVDHTCPACGHTDRCAVDEWASFLNDRFGLCCEACRHLWQVPTNAGDYTPFMPKCSGCNRPADAIADHRYFETGAVIARCQPCHRYGIIGSSEPWVYQPPSEVRRLRDENDELYRMAKRDWERRKAARIAAWTRALDEFACPNCPGYLSI
jgi:predicted RNA-binding Zn-ribbon protein involved in translation (DUF1610 family)